jgi:hypothetical protein
LAKGLIGAYDGGGDFPKVTARLADIRHGGAERMLRRIPIEHLATRLMSSLLLLTCLGWPLAARAEDPPSATASDQILDDRALDDRTLDDLFAELDAPGFDVRERAARRLDHLAALPEMARPLTRRIQEILLLPTTSFEMRSQLDQYLKKLPVAEIGPEERIDQGEVPRLIAELDSDLFAVRQGAAHRLEWLLHRPELVTPIMLVLKARLANATMETDRPTLMRLWKAARGAWLLGDPADWKLPAVAPEQITVWIDALLREAPEGIEGGAWIVHETAERELVELLVRDDHRPIV